MTLCLCRMTRRGFCEVLDMAYVEALWRLEGANALEEEMHPEGD